MDQLVSPTSSSSSPSPGSVFSTAANLQDLVGFVSCDALDQWLGDDVGIDDSLDGAPWADEGSRSAGANGLPAGEAPAVAPAAKRRGRKPGPRTDGAAVSHVEAERQRRDKLNRRFCDLRAAVPTVSRMDKASLLADATSYIAELRGRVEKLEAEARQAAASRLAVETAPSYSFGYSGEEQLEVRLLGRDSAALRLTTTTVRHATARFMGALRSLDMPVQHASVCRLGGVTVQDAVVEVPAALLDEGLLRAALLHRLQGSV